MRIHPVRRKILTLAVSLVVFLPAMPVWAVSSPDDSFQIAQFRRKPTPEPSVTPIPLPRFYARHVEEGNKLLAQNRLQEAMDEFFAAKTINPDYYPTYIGMGNVYRKMGQLDRAVENYQIAVRLLNPSYASEHVLRGDYFAERHQYQKALDDYWDVLRIDPQAGNQYTLAMRHLRFNDEKKAVKAFEAAIAIDEDYAAPQFQLGNLYFHDNKLKKAVDSYKKAVELEPENSLYRFALGTAMYKQATSKAKPDMKMVQDATHEFEQAYALGRRDARLHFNLGTCYIMTEKYDKAIQHLEEAVKRGLRDEEAFYNLGNANFRKAMTINFTWDGYDSLTDPKKLKQNNDKFDYLLKSIMLYELALKQKSDYAQVYYDLGASYYRLSELKLTPKFIPKMLKILDTREDYNGKGVKNFQPDMLQHAINAFKDFQSHSSDGKKKAVASKIADDLQKQLTEMNRH